MTFTVSLPKLKYKPFECYFNLPENVKINVPTFFNGMSMTLLPKLRKKKNYRLISLPNTKILTKIFSIKFSSTEIPIVA